PRVEEVEEGSSREERSAQGQDDPPEEPPFAAAVHPGGLAQFLWNRPEKLAHEEDVERAADEGRKPERSQRSDESQLLEHAVERDHQDREGHHHGAECEREKGVTTLPRESCKPVGDDGV